MPASNELNKLDHFLRSGSQDAGALPLPIVDVCGVRLGVRNAVLRVECSERSEEKGAQKSKLTQEIGEEARTSHGPTSQSPSTGIAGGAP